MSIVSTVIASDTTRGNIREILYRCTDSESVTHNYGPVLTVDANFDADAHKTIVATKVGNALAEAEARELLG